MYRPTNLANLRIDFAQIEFGRKIGEGGQATVYEAMLNGQKVAVKKFLMNQNPDPDLIAKLNHNNVNRLIGYCITPPCILTEFCPVSLHKKIRTHEIVDFKSFFNWSTQIAHGMAYLHSVNITHRDLKSENILIAYDGAIKICDFDFSKQTPNNSAMIHTLLGTPHWTAPEIFRGESYTRKIDIFSYGVVLWEMLMQKMPYDKIRNANLLLEMNKIRIKFPHDLPEAWLKVCASFLSDDPNRRPEFVDILKEFKTIKKIDEPEWVRLKRRWLNNTTEYWTPSDDMAHNRIVREKVPVVQNPYKPYPLEKEDKQENTVVYRPHRNVNFHLPPPSTCRNRKHKLTKTNGSHNNMCELCQQTGNNEQIFVECEMCQQIAHKRCIEAARLPCLPRKRITFTAPEGLLKCDPNSLDKAKRQNTILEIYDKNFAPDYPVEMLQEMLAAARFGAELPANQKETFLTALRNDSIAQLRAFIVTTLEPWRQCTTALLVTHLQNYRRSHPTSFQIDHITITQIVHYWMGILVPADLRRKMQALLCDTLETEFWEQFLIVS